MAKYKYKNLLICLLVILMGIESSAAIVGDSDGNAFVSKSEFEALKSDFNKQVDKYNKSLDSKIDGAIASYLDGIKVVNIEVKKPLFSTFYTGKKIKSVNSNDAMFFSKGENMWNLNFDLIQVWDYKNNVPFTTDVVSNVDDGNLSIKTWSYSLSSSAVDSSDKAKRTLVQKTKDNKWRIVGNTSDYYETHNYFGGGHSYMVDYGFATTGYFLVPWRFDVGTTTILDTSGTQTGGWRTNMPATADSGNKNTTITPIVNAWGTSKTYTLTGDFNSFLVFNNTTKQYVFDVDNVTKLIGNSEFVSNNCYDWFLSSRISASAYLSFLNGISGTTITSVGQKCRAVVPYQQITKPTADTLNSVGINDTQKGKSHYPPVLAPIDINKTSFTSVLAADTNKYAYKESGTDKEAKDYSVCDGFPFYATEKEETKFKWYVNNAGSSGKIYFKVGPFGSGVTESNCIYSKTLTSGDNTVEFTTNEKSLIWVKWDIGVNIDVDKSLKLLVTAY